MNTEKELRETIKIKLESSEKRWDDIVAIIKKYSFKNFTNFVFYLIIILI